MPKFWPMTNYSSGHLAEKWALLWLWIRGYHLVQRNFVVGRGTGAGEVDLIVSKHRTLVFVEVKKRSTLESGLYAIRPKNQRRIERTSQVFLARFPQYQNYQIRYDAIVICPFHLKHIKNAWRSFLILLCLGLGGCQMWGTLINGAHSLWTIIDDDRPLNQDVNDIALYTKIRSALTEREIKSALDVQITVFQNDVLLTGALPNLDEIQQTIETVWQIPDVRYVYNYIRSGETLSTPTTLAESALANSIQTKLSLTEGIKSSNYKIVVENGVAYVMGIQRDSAEWNSARSIIADTFGIEKIICLMNRG